MGTLLKKRVSLGLPLLCGKENLINVLRIVVARKKAVTLRAELQGGAIKDIAVVDKNANKRREKFRRCLECTAVRKRCYGCSPMSTAAASRNMLCPQMKSATAH